MTLLWPRDWGLREIGERVRRLWLPTTERAVLCIFQLFFRPFLLGIYLLANKVLSIHCESRVVP